MTPRDRCDQLLEAVMPFAEDTLNQHGEFYPFGASMAHGGQITLLQPMSKSEFPNTDELISVALESFRKSATENKITTSALVVNMTVRQPNSEATQDAVAVMLDDYEGYSVIVYYPYSKQGLVRKKIHLEPPFAQAGENSVFKVAEGL